MEDSTPQVVEGGSSAPRTTMGGGGAPCGQQQDSRRGRELWSVDFHIPILPQIFKNVKSYFHVSVKTYVVKVSGNGLGGFPAPEPCGVGAEQCLRPHCVLSSNKKEGGNAPAPCSPLSIDSLLRHRVRAGPSAIMIPRAARAPQPPVQIDRMPHARLLPQSHAPPRYSRFLLRRRPLAGTRDRWRGPPPHRQPRCPCHAPFLSQRAVDRLQRTGRRGLGSLCHARIGRNRRAPDLPGRHGPGGGVDRRWKVDPLFQRGRRAIRARPTTLGSTPRGWTTGLASLGPRKSPEPRPGQGTRPRAQHGRSRAVEALSRRHGGPALGR